MLPPSTSVLRVAAGVLSEAERTGLAGAAHAGGTRIEVIALSATPRTTVSVGSSDEEVRRHILEEADRLLAAGDEALFSIRRLVERCGHSAPIIYRHFGDKKHLLADLLEVRLTDLAARLRAVPESADSADRLRALVHVFAEFGRDWPVYYRLFTRTDDADAARPPATDTCSELLSEPLDRLADEGRIARDDLPLLKDVFWALVHGVVTLQVMHPDREWDERLLEVALDGMIAGTIAPEATGEGRVGAQAEGRS